MAAEQKAPVPTMKPEEDAPAVAAAGPVAVAAPDVVAAGREPRPAVTPKDPPKLEDAARPEYDTQPIGRVAGDLGVPMLPGSPDEPQGPEDALGLGPKRGDYTGRLGGSDYQPHISFATQRPRAEEHGDVLGKKGGVDTAAESRL